MTDTIIELSLDAFDAQYKLRTNHLHPAAGWDNGEGAGCLFETFGQELAFVRSQDPRAVWTLIDGDDGDQYLLSGFHLVNRIGYLISTAPVPEGTTIQVRIPMQSEETAETTAHTPEPWKLDGFVIFNPASSLRKDAQDFLGGQLAVVGGLGTKDTSEQLANARRLVAAVNACKGISTEALESTIIANLRHLLGELVTVASDLDAAIDGVTDQFDAERRKLMPVLRAAEAVLAKATGRAA